jgi:hypothetical protein
MVPALSMTRAAGAAAADGLGPFSSALWTQIENGYTQTAQGRVDYHGTPERIARMARVVGATPRELERAGRRDAARTLAKLPPLQAATKTSLADRVARIEAILASQLEKVEAEDEEGDRARRRA